MLFSSLVLCVFWNFAPIPFYRENKTPYAIPTDRQNGAIAFSDECV